MRRHRGPQAVRKLLVAGTSLLLALLVSGCAVTALAPGSSVELEPGTGILVVRTDSSWVIRSLRLSGGVVLPGAPSGTSAMLVVLEAGTYRWQRVDLEREFGPFRYLRWFRMSDIPYWEFRVEEGALCYPGDLLIEGGAGTQRLDLRSADRSSMLLPSIEGPYARLLQRYPLRYTGSGRDDYFAEYLRQKQEAHAAGASASGAGSRDP